MEKNIIFFNFYYCISPRKVGELINAKEIKFDYHEEIEKKLKILEHELSSSFIIKKKIYQYVIKKIVKLFSKYPFNEEYCIAIHDMLPSALIVLIIFKFYELFHYLPHVFYSYNEKYFSYNGKYVKITNKIYPKKNLNFLVIKNKLKKEYDKVYVFYNTNTDESEIPYSKIRSNSFIRIKLPFYGFYEKKSKEIIERKLYEILEKEVDFCNNKKILFIINDGLMAFQWGLIVIIYKFFEITNLLPDIMLLPHFLDRFKPFIISPDSNKIKIIK